jgi:mRNA-degrading endonuclease RelE of RelBE toxin-antitoxin system
MKLINIHIPKTAGTSFTKSLEQNYQKLSYDYGHKISRDVNELISEFNDFNKNLIVNNYKSINCISGHILPIRYKKLYDLDWKFITWLREPSQRLYSSYLHLIRDSKKNDFGKYLVDNRILFEDFVFLPKIKNFYQRFFYNFPVENYFFIGVVERYKEDLIKLSQLSNMNFIEYNENRNGEKSNNIYDIEPNLLDKIKKYHSDDYRLYYKILNKI